MELCTRSTTIITHLPASFNGHGYLAGKSVDRISLPLQRNVASLVLQSRTLRCSRKFPGETVTEETSTGVNEFGVEDRDGVVVAAEEKNSNSEAPQAEDEETQALEFLNDIKLDSDKTYSILLYGSGAIVALYLTSAIVSSLEAIPLVSTLKPPKQTLFDIIVVTFHI
jgi:hypothetical protein